MRALPAFFYQGKVMSIASDIFKVSSYLDANAFGSFLYNYIDSICIERQKFTRFIKDNVLIEQTKYIFNDNSAIKCICQNHKNTSFEVEECINNNF